MSDTTWLTLSRVRRKERKRWRKARKCSEAGGESGGWVIVSDSEAPRWYLAPSWIPPRPPTGTADVPRHRFLEDVGRQRRVREPLLALPAAPEGPLARKALGRCRAEGVTQQRAAVRGQATASMP